jgi:hypothetical protein
MRLSGTSPACVTTFPSGHRDVSVFSAAPRVLPATDSLRVPLRRQTVSAAPTSPAHGERFVSSIHRNNHAQ